jgi:hypothetical protein
MLFGILKQTPSQGHKGAICVMHGVDGREERRRQRTLAERWPALARQPDAVEWLRIQAELGMSPRTIDATVMGSPTISPCVGARTSSR